MMSHWRLLSKQWLNKQWLSKQDDEPLAVADSLCEEGKLLLIHRRTVG